MDGKSESNTMMMGISLYEFSRYFSEWSPQPMAAVEGTTHRVVYINRAFCDLVGKAPHQLIGRPFAQAVPEGENNGCLAMLDRVYRTGQPEVLPEQEHAGPPPVYWSYSVWAIRGENQCSVGVMIQITDATEVAIFRRRLSRMNEELVLSSLREHELAAKRLNQTIEELQKVKGELEIGIQKLSRSNWELVRSNKDLEQFAYISSHDLQEPLRMVVSYVQLLEKEYGDKLDADARQFIAFAVEGAKRMQSLIKSLLEFSRIKDQGTPSSPVDCEQLLNAVQKNLEVHIREIQAEVTHDPLPTVMGDESQLMQVFQNLIDNALKYRRPEVPPRVHLWAEQRDRQWLFGIRDNGIGINSKFHDHIFTIFKRLHTRSKYAGSGIGLSIVKRIIELHGGTIWLESEPEKGSTFYFTLPATDDKIK